MTTMTNSEKLSRAMNLIEAGLLGKHLVSSYDSENKMSELWTNYIYIRIVNHGSYYRITGTFNTDDSVIEYNLERGTNPTDEVFAELLISESKKNRRFVL